VWFCYQRSPSDDEVKAQRRGLRSDPTGYWRRQLHHRTGELWHRSATPVREKLPLFFADAFYDVSAARSYCCWTFAQMDLRVLRRRIRRGLQIRSYSAETVEENIRLGSKWIADKDVQRAAETSNVADFIRTLPEGSRKR